MKETINQRLELLQEECAELIQAVSKYKRAFLNDPTLRMERKDTEINLIEEMADVEVCIEELKKRFKCEEQIKQVKAIKHIRRKKLLKESEENRENNRTNNLKARSV